MTDTNQDRAPDSETLAAQNRARLHDRVENDFRNHPPVGEGVADKMDVATELFVEMAHWLVENVPAGREQSMALTKLEECSQMTKAGIARNQPAPQ